LILHVTQVQRLGGYVLALAFNDGKACEVDFDSSLWGSMFEPLRDKKTFDTVHISDELGTIVWDNGADFAPEYLRDLAK